VTAQDFRTVLDGPSLAAMGHGRVTVTVRAEDSPRSPILSGTLVPRFTCDTLEAALVLSSADSTRDEREGRGIAEGEGDQALATRPTGGKGLAWMAVTTDGLINFWLKYGQTLSDPVVIVGLCFTTKYFLLHRLEMVPQGTTITVISIDNGRRSRRLRRTAANDLARNLRATGGGMFRANGSMRIGAKDVEDLFNSVSKTAKFK